jgi:hypothetical protein
MDDDSKENNLSTTAANMLFTSDLTDSAKSLTRQHEAIAGNAEVEKLGVLFRDYHKAIFPAKAAFLLSIARSRRLNLRFQNLIKFCS